MQDATAAHDIEATEFSLNATIIGLLARAYANAPYSTTPQRSWGAEMPNRNIHWRNDGYSVAIRNHEGKSGLVLTRTKNQLNGGNEQERFWIPIDAFTEVRVTLPAVRL